LKELNKTLNVNYKAETIASPYKTNQSLAGECSHAILILSFVDVPATADHGFRQQFAAVNSD
jgi:hypothetical protein